MRWSYWVLLQVITKRHLWVIYWSFCLKIISKCVFPFLDLWDFIEQVNWGLLSRNYSSNFLLFRVWDFLVLLFFNSVWRFEVKFAFSIRFWPGSFLSLVWRNSHNKLWRSLAVLTSDNSFRGIIKLLLSCFNVFRSRGSHKIQVPWFDVKEAYWSFQLTFKREYICLDSRGLFASRQILSAFDQSWDISKSCINFSRSWVCSGRKLELILRPFFNKV